MAAVSDVFLSLAMPPAATDTLAAAPFPGHLTHRIAKNSEGQATVLIAGIQDAARSTALPVRTEYLSVLYSTEYRLQHQSGEESTETYSAVTCLDRDAAVIRYFLHLMDGFLGSLGERPATAEIVRVVRTTVELFRTLAIPSQTAVQGVWAELLLIAESQDKLGAANAWHADPRERYDFALERERLDVKSSSNRRRSHYFSHEQLSPPAATKLWIASVFTERASGGMTLETVLDRACDGLSSEVAVRIRMTTAATLGSSFSSALGIAFDYQLAIDSVRYYEAASIPSLPASLPPEISEIHYRSDLTRAASASADAHGSALLARLPRMRA